VPKLPPKSPPLLLPAPDAFTTQGASLIGIKPLSMRGIAFPSPTSNEESAA